jgi:hypothetical protein
MRKALPQVAQVRLTDCAARRQARQQYFCRLLGGAGKPVPQCWQVSRFSPADLVPWPFISADRQPQARHRVAALSDLTSSTLPHSVQARFRVERFLGLARCTTKSVPAAVSWTRVMRIPVSGEMDSGPGPRVRDPGGLPLDPSFRAASTSRTAQAPCFTGRSSCSAWTPGAGGFPEKIGPNAGELVRLASQIDFAQEGPTFSAIYWPLLTFSLAGSSLLARLSLSCPKCRPRRRLCLALRIKPRSRVHLPCV